MLKYTCQAISWKKRNNTTLEGRDNLFELSWETRFISSIDVLDWFKTTTSSGIFVCKYIIEDGEMEDKSCNLVFENKEQSWLCEWFSSILWQDWQNGSFKSFLTFVYWWRIGDLSGDKRDVHFFLSGYWYK